MVWCRICGFTLLFLFLTSNSIHAYERDVHYDLTKYLARWADFSEDEAEQVATADQEIDAKPEFNPLPNPNFCPELRKIAGPASAIVAIPVACKNDPEFQRMVTAQRAYHFADSERLQALRESAFQGRNLKILGHYLHALQDTFAHSLMDYADLPPLDKLVANLGRLPDAKIIGHFLYGHSLDKTYERPNLAEQMARYVYAELVLFKGSVNRWNDIDAAVVRFVREQDSRKKLAHLSESTLQGPAPTTSQPQSVRPDKPQEPMYEGRTLVEWQADLRDPSPKVRERAALALRNFGLTVVPILTQTLRDSDANVRWAAANALGEIGPAAKEAVPALVQALEDIDGMVRARVKTTLRRIDPAALEEWERAGKTGAEEEARPRKEAAQRQAQQQRIAQSQQIEQVIATLIEGGMSSNPFGSIRIGKTPDEVARQYIEAFKARDVTTLVALNHRGAIEEIAKVKRDYYPASWKHHLEEWARRYLMSFLTRLDLAEVWHEENWTQRDMRSILTLYDHKPMVIFRVGDYERDCHVGTRGRCWVSPKFVAVKSLTYAIEIQDMKKLDGDMVEVPVKVRYPPGSLIIKEYEYVDFIKDARIYFVIDVSNNSVVEFRGYDVTNYDKP